MSFFIHTCAELVVSGIGQSELRELIARSADFYGPHNEKSVLQELAYKNLKKGKGPGWMIDADKIYSFTYTPDAAKAVAMVKLLGIFIPILREMPKMMYQNDRGYFFDSSKFNRRFSFTPTSYEQGVKETVAAG
jgi:nucleoside-diphosphate-sugar epimerase